MDDRKIIVKFSMKIRANVHDRNENDLHYAGRFQMGIPFPCYVPLPIAN